MGFNSGFKVLIIRYKSYRCYIGRARNVSDADISEDGKIVFLNNVRTDLYRSPSEQPLPSEPADSFSQVC